MFEVEFILFEVLFNLTVVFEFLLWLLFEIETLGDTLFEGFLFEGFLSALYVGDSTCMIVFAVCEVLATLTVGL